jgi:hypothetical protein
MLTKSACNWGTEIFNSWLMEKSSSQHITQATATAASKKAIALNDIGCKLAIHPRREEAMHPATK